MRLRFRREQVGRGPAAWLTALLVLCLLSGIGISAEHHHDASGDVIPCAVCHMGQVAEVPAPPVVAAVATAPAAEGPAPVRVFPPSAPSLRTPRVRGPPLVV
jgi:hypothetical protein